MKRGYLFGTLTLYFIVILMCYVIVKMRVTYEESASFTRQSLLRKKDKMRFIRECRKRFDKESPNLWTNQFKNPCFCIDGKLHCLPYFLVAGFPKCGTTDLFERMSHHPEFIPPRMKELHWLSRYRFLPVFTPNWTEDIYEKYAPEKVIGLKLYTKMFNKLSGNLEISEGESYAISADFSPSTMWDNDLYTYVGEVTGRLGYFTYDFVHQLNPCMKIIVMLRDPVERLYSDYLFLNGEKTANDFHSQVKKVIKLYKSCMKVRSPLLCFYDHKIARKSKIRLRIGAYSTYIAEWLKVFPRDQMMFIRMEDYATNTKKILNEIFEFLDMEPVSEDVMRKMLYQKPSNSRDSRGKSFEPMYNKTFQLLSRFYSPFNHNLSLLLDNTKYRWRKA